MMKESGGTSDRLRSHKNDPFTAQDPSLLDDVAVADVVYPLP